MNTDQSIAQLFGKYLDNSINKEEYVELLQYFGSTVDEDKMHKYILSALKAENSTKAIDQERFSNTLAKVDRSLHEQIFSDDSKEIYNLKEPAVQNLFFIKRLYPYAAAAVFLILGAAIYMYTNQLKSDQNKTIVQAGIDIDPGTNKATLTLADGSKIHLRDNQDGIVIGAEDIRYTDGSGVIQRVSGKPVSTMLSLSTPKGGQYQVTLSDGTKVFVNSASTLKYPSNFNGAKREVEISGEAYFEVAHDKKMPFIVKSDKQEIQVLGTQFNVSNYEGEMTSTTLLTGSIKLQFVGNNKPILLAPGQQAILKNNIPTIQQVDAGDHIAWTKGLFVFNDVSLREIMNQLTRWYDIEVIYPKDFPEERFYAEIPRNRKLSEVLRQLARSGNFKFEQQGRRIMVRK